MHSLLVGALLAHEGFAVDGHYLVASQQSRLLRRTACYDVLHGYGVVVDEELYAYAVERALEVVARQLGVLGSDIDGVGVELSQYLWYGFLYHVVDVDGVNILVVDDVQQVAELVAA